MSNVLPRSGASVLNTAWLAPHARSLLRIAAGLTFLEHGRAALPSVSRVHVICWRRGRGAATGLTWASTALAAAAGVRPVLTAKAEVPERAVAAVRNHTNM